MGAHNPRGQLSGGCQAAGREQLSPETGATKRRSSFQSPCVALGNTHTHRHTSLPDFFFLFFFFASSGTLFLRTAAVASLKPEVSVPIFPVWMFLVMDGKTQVLSLPRVCVFVIAPNYTVESGRSARATSRYLSECLILNFILRSLQSRTKTRRSPCPELEEAPLICN